MKSKPIQTKKVGRYSFLAFVLFVFPVLLATDCSTDSGPEEGLVTFETLRVTYPSWSEKEGTQQCQFNASNIEFDTTNADNGPGNVELVITESNEFDRYITCNDTVQVNLENYFVAGGISDRMQCVYMNEHNLSFQDDSLHYDVNLVMGPCRAIWRTSYIIKVSNEYSNYPFSFNYSVE